MAEDQALPANSTEPVSFGTGTAIRILETPAEMAQVELLQRLVWPGDDLGVVPGHQLLAAAHGGGLVIGAYSSSAQGESQLTGFVYGFPGLYITPDGPRLKHCSHMLGVHPEHRGKGLGFALKRAQWQMVRHQGLDRITWTYDPLLSRNAFLNISRLGAVCSTYLPNFYGDLRDGLNRGLATDRFQVDWWVNSRRVNRRLSRRVRRQLDLAHYLAGGAQVVTRTRHSASGWPEPIEDPSSAVTGEQENALLLVEIPADFQALKAADLPLALAWRHYSRELFVSLFESGYLVTDFVHLPGSTPRSYYVMSHGEATL